MIKVNSKVIIKELVIEGESTIKNAAQKLRANIELRVTDGSNKYSPPTMIVEGLYHRNQFGIWNINDVEVGEAKPEYAKCFWYNTRNELQSEYITLEILTEL